MIENKEDLKKVLALCYADSSVLAKTLFPRTFELPFSQLHEQIFKLVDSPYPYVAIAAPRGIGKTTIAKLMCSRAILFRDSHFITYISKSATFSEMQTENLKRSLLSNKMVKQLFGNIKAQSVEMDEVFSKKAWVANGMTFVLPRGREQQLRGLNYDDYRPDLFIIDDLIKKKEVDNEEIRLATKQWFNSDVLKAKPTGSGKKFKFIYIDTVKHEDDLMSDLLLSPRWKSVQLSICDENYRTLAPDYYSQKELDQELEYHEKEGLMDVFAMEFMSQPMSRKAAAFKRDYFKYYDETDPDFIAHEPEIKNVVIIDPARTVNPSNADTGFAVWGVNVRTNALYLREAFGEKLHPDQIYQRAFELMDRYRGVVLGIEVTGLKEFITHPLKNEMIRRGKYFHIEELHARRGQGEFAGPQGGKKARIASLISYYRQGLVYHNRHSTRTYEMQLLSFPKSKKWDIMDAASYIVEILESNQQYFLPTNEDYLLDDPVEYEQAINKLMKYDEPAFTGWRIM